MNEGVCRECGPKVLDVERGVDKGYCVVLSLGLHGLYGLRRGRVGWQMVGVGWVRQWGLRFGVFVIENHDRVEVPNKGR